MRRLTAPLSVALCLALTQTSIVAQTPQGRVPGQPGAAQAIDPNTQAIIDRAQRLYEMGEQAFAQNDLERSRRSFDDAVDAILTSGVDVRANEALNGFYRELIERIHKHQMIAQDGEANGFAEQGYVPADSEIAALNDADLAALASVPDEQVFDGTYNFPFTAGPPVYQFISYFTAGRGRGTMESGLRRSGRYRKMAERIFREEGVPTDLIWLAQVESVWKPAALSHAAAKGIWQFIPSTGRRFGLEQDYWADQRSDPEKSTRAAARYLKFLYNYFAGDWLLAMAAYNSGEGNVSKAIARSGYADFWEIHRLGYLPTETRNYVPAILAVIIVAHHQKRYGFNVTPEPAWSYDVAQIGTQTDLEVVAELCGTSPEVIREFNPHLRRNLTPPGSTTLRIPVGKKQSFETAYAALSPAERLGRQVEEPGDELAADRPAAPRDPASGFAGTNTTVSYKARPGDSLTALANRYGVSTVELARLNSLDASAELKTGQVLRVPQKGAAGSRFDERTVRKSAYRAKPERPAAKSKAKASKKPAKAPAKKSRKRH